MDQHGLFPSGRRVFSGRAAGEVGRYLPEIGVLNKKSPADIVQRGCIVCVGIDLLSRGIYRSTISAGGLNDSVRNGKRWNPTAKDTNFSCLPAEVPSIRDEGRYPPWSRSRVLGRDESGLVFLLTKIWEGAVQKGGLQAGCEAGVLESGAVRRRTTSRGLLRDDGFDAAARRGGFLEALLFRGVRMAGALTRGPAVLCSPRRGFLDFLSRDFRQKFKK